MSEQIPIMDIPVSVDADMDKIKALTEMFEAYSKATEGTPLKLPAEMTVEQRELVAGKAGGGARDGKGKDSSPGLEKTLKDFGKEFREFTKGLKQTATYLKGIFESTLKWTLGFGLLGGLGTMGYGRLLNETVNNVQGGAGVGVDPGTFQATRNIYSHMGGEGALAALDKASKDPAMMVPLLALGLTPGNTTLPEFYQRVFDRFKNEDRHTWGSLFGEGGWHLNEIFSFEDFNRTMAHGFAGDLDQMAGLYRTQVKSLAIDPHKAFQAQMLGAQVEGNVGRVINTFVERMGELNGPLGNLSDKVADSVIAFINGKGFASLVTSAGESLDTFATWLGSPEGTEAVKEFGRNIVTVNGFVGKLIKKLAIWSGDGEQKKPGSGAGFSDLIPESTLGKVIWSLALLHPVGRLFSVGYSIYEFMNADLAPPAPGRLSDETTLKSLNGTIPNPRYDDAMRLKSRGTQPYEGGLPVPGADNPSGFVPEFLGYKRYYEQHKNDTNKDDFYSEVSFAGMLKVISNTFSRNGNVYGFDIPGEEPEQHAQAAKRRPKMSTGDQKALLEHFASLENTYGLPENWLYALAMVESSMNPMAVSEKGAAGMFQFMPRTAPEYGLVGTEVFDPYKSAQAAAKMSAGLLKKYHGDPQKALAAYNWGQGNVDLFGLNHRPNQTREHFRRFQSYMSAPVRPPYPAPSDGQSMHIPVSGSAGTHIIQVEVRSSPGSDFITQLAAQNHGIAY